MEGESIPRGRNEEGGAVLHGAIHPLVLCVHPRPPFISVAYFRRRNPPLLRYLRYHVR